MKKSEAYVKSLLKALLILEQFNTENLEKGIHELSANTKLPVSTIQRLVNTLQFKGYLIQNPKTNKYYLGYALYNLSKSVNKNLSWLDDAKYFMKELVDKHQENVNLAILEGRDVIYLATVDSPHILGPNFKKGSKYPVHCSALGKCLIAYLPPKTLEAILVEPLKKFTNKSLTDINKLKLELNKVREQGYAIDDEEFQDNLRCIAAPIKNNNMDGLVVAAISVTAPKQRMPLERLYSIKDDLIQTADKISKLLL